MAESQYPAHAAAHSQLQSHSASPVSKSRVCPGAVAPLRHSGPSSDPVGQYFLAGMPVPVTTRRVADLGLILWFMKAW